MIIPTLFGHKEIFHGSILQFYQKDKSIFQVCNIYVEPKFIDIKLYNLTSIREGDYYTVRVFNDPKDGCAFLNAKILYSE